MNDIVNTCNNYETVFTVVSSISTTIAVLISLYTIIEVRRQRESTYKPQLIIDEFEYDMDIETFPFEIQFDDKKGVGVQSGKLKKIYLKCLNIGFASASNLKFKFGCNIEKYVKIINQYNQEIEKNYNPDKLNLMRLSYNKSNGLIIGHSTQLHLNNTEYGNNLRYNYFLPVNIDSKPIEIEIPYFIVYIHQVIFYYHLISKDSVKSDFEFNLKATYLDIGNKSHEKSFDFIIKPLYNGTKIMTFKLILKSDTKSNLSRLIFWK